MCKKGSVKFAKKADTSIYKFGSLTSGKCFAIYLRLSIFWSCFFFQLHLRQIVFNLKTQKLKFSRNLYLNYLSLR